jgi:hypothetical protein
MPQVMEMVGKTRVVVKDGKVVEVGEPEVKWCPLFAKLRGVQDITPEEVKKIWRNGSAIWACLQPGAGFQTLILMWLRSLRDYDVRPYRDGAG